MTPEGLAAHYLALRNEGGASDVEHLEAVLQQFVSEGRRAWPDITLSEHELVTHLAQRCPSLPDPVLRGPDLYLVCGCAQGVPAALAAFDSGYLAQVPDFLERGGTHRDIGDEVRQLLGQRLLVGTPGRIVDYQGRGSLASWVRTAAGRTALNLMRAERRHGRAAVAAAADSIVVVADPELDFIKVRFRPLFKEALRSAMAALPSRDRAVLRLHYGQRVGLGQIAVSYSVHRVTVTRWLRDAERVVLEETRRLLRESLKIDPAECDHLVGLVQSRLDVTISSLLRSAGSA